VKTAVEMLAIAGLMLPFALAPTLVVESGARASWAAIGFAGVLVGLLWLAALLSLYTAAGYVRAVRRAG
jgi:phosphatidylglycerophosphate synthase